MAYTLLVVKDSRKLRDARLLREEEAQKVVSVEKNGEVLEALNPPEDKNQPPRPKNASCKSLFDLTHVIEAWKGVLKPRPNHGRTLLILLIIVFDLEIFIIVSGSDS